MKFGVGSSEHNPSAESGELCKRNCEQCMQGRKIRYWTSMVQSHFLMEDFLPRGDRVDLPIAIHHPSRGIAKGRRWQEASRYHRSQEVSVPRNYSGTWTKDRLILNMSVPVLRICGMIVWWWICSVSGLLVTNLWFFISWSNTYE